MKTLKEYEDKGFEGIDASLDISLYEYGLIWVKGIEGHEKDYHFVFGVRCDNEGNFTKFDWADIAIDCNPEKEWDWAEWDNVADCSGVSKEDLLSYSLPMIVETLVGYYGYENVFGSAYYPFEIVNE